MAECSIELCWCARFDRNDSQTNSLGGSCQVVHHRKRIWTRRVRKNTHTRQVWGDQGQSIMPRGATLCSAATVGEVRLESWLCENAKTLNRDRGSYSSKTS